MRNILLTFLAGLSVLAHAADPLPVKEVFKPEIRQSEENGLYQTSVTIHFPAGYYLYADKTSITGIEGKETRSPSQSHHDPYLGEVNIWNTPPTLTIDHTQPAKTLTLKTQGCQENVICYPPTTWELTIPKTAPALTTLPANLDAGKNLFTKKNDLLDERDAFQVSAEPNHDGITVSVKMPEGYYIYRKSLSADLNGKKMALHLPQGDIHHDDFLGKQEIYRHSLEFSLTPPAPIEKEQQLSIHLQGCAEGRVCYPPISRDFIFPAELFLGMKNPSVTEKITQNPVVAQNALPTKEEKTITDRLNDNFLLALPLLLLLGIGVSFTACVYPLIPIVTSLVVGRNTTTGRAYRLISVYVLAMGVAMGILGAVFGIFEINLQLVFQKPWIAVLAALLFIGLSLSLFDVYTLQAPSWLQNPIDKITRKQQSGSYFGAAMMGALSVLVVSPCATPILTALLLFTTQTTPLKGALALFFFGLGTGLPLFLFAGAFRQFMPKAGSWMDTIKKVFAFALLAIAAYLITRILPLVYALSIWALFALFFAVYWFNAQDKKRLFVSGVAFLLSIALTVQAFSSQFGNDLSAIRSDSTAHLPSARFQSVQTLTEIENALTLSDQPVILDFYADWCVACHKWEKEIWNNADFSSPLSKFTLLKVDVTDFNANHKAIFQKLGLVGPPAVLIYPAHGQLNNPLEKIIGETSPEEFAALLTELSRK